MESIGTRTKGNESLKLSDSSKKDLPLIPRLKSRVFPASIKKEVNRLTIAYDRVFKSAITGNRVSVIFFDLHFVRRIDRQIGRLLSVS